VTTVAILAQKPAAVQAWLQDNALPFTVLIDESRDTLRAYGVWHRLGVLPDVAWNISRPALFLIKPGKTIARSFIASRQTEFPSRGSSFVRSRTIDRHAQCITTWQPHRTPLLFSPAPQLLLATVGTVRELTLRCVRERARGDKHR
jgi:hypothetical protein